LPWWPCSLVLHSVLSCSVGTVGFRQIVTLSPSSVFALLGCLASLPPPASHALDPLAPYCYTLTSCHLTASYTSSSPWVSLLSRISSGGDAHSPVTRDHVREAVISSGRPKVYPLWLASPLLSGSPRQVAFLAFFTLFALYSKVVTR